MPVARVARIRQLDEKDLLSFAIITTDPPPEISEAGHDRCQVPIKSEDLDAWLSPDPNNLEAMDEILRDNGMPHFAHTSA
ncbi:SOS response-associated peptidase family protein [Ralstonia mannitolilytica]